MLAGPQWPPSSLVPESFTVEAADELIDFAEMIGQPLDEWQANVLRIGCGEQVDGQWTAPEMALFVQRQNGKGAVFETRALGGLFLFGERLQYYTAHNEDTAKMAFGRVEELVEGCDDLSRRVRRINKVHAHEALELTNGAELRFRTRGKGPGLGKANKGTKSGGKGRGFSCDTLFLDEALYLQQDALDALGPTMLARPNPQIWYLSTPPLVGDAPIMRIRDDGLAAVPNMAMALWCNEAEADLSDDEVLAYANPAWGTRLNRRIMEVLRRRLGPEGFARECGGIWPPPIDEAWLVIPGSAWLGAEKPSSMLIDCPAFGVYVSPDRSWAAIGTAGMSSLGGRHVEVTGDGVRLDFRPGSPDWVVSRLLELERHDPSVLVIDDKAVADAAEVAGLKVHRATAADVVTGCQLLYDGVVGADLDARVLHIGQQPLTDAIRGAVKRDVGGSWAWARRDLTVEVAPVAAVSLALVGHCTPRLHRLLRLPAAAYVDTGPVRPERGVGSSMVRAAPRGEDVNAARLREELERMGVGV